MSKDPSDIAPPPEFLLRGMQPPNVVSAPAEIRSDASISFPQPLPEKGDTQTQRSGARFLRFPALVVWRLETSWPHAQRIQKWLLAAPPKDVPGATQEEALASLIGALISDADGQRLEYLGTFVTSRVASPTYTLLIGMRKPIPLDAYQQAWLRALDALAAAEATSAWQSRVRDFLRLFLAQPGIREEFTMMGTLLGSFADEGGEREGSRYPMIRVLLP